MLFKVSVEVDDRVLSDNVLRTDGAAT